MDTRDAGPSEDQVMDWNIHNDHADGADHGHDDDGGPGDVPDTNQILADLLRAETIVNDLAGARCPDSRYKDLVMVWENFRDQWAYLRHCLEAEHAPLPDAWKPWKHAGVADWAGDTTGPFGGPDEQLDYLRRAVGKTSDWLESRPGHGEDPVDALIDHLVACAAAVDAMCSEGILPSAWRPDPRVTAAGGAAAKAGWDLAASPGRTLGPARVELMGHRIRVGVVSEVTMFGQPFLRIDFPQDSESTQPEFYQPGSLYGLLPLDALPRPSRTALPAPGADYADYYDDDPTGMQPPGWP
jgi:hypothetical protein